MGLFFKGVKLLSALLNRSDEGRRSVMRPYAKAHGWEEIGKLNKGELVRMEHLLGLVVRPQSANHKGLVAVIAPSKQRWYFLLHFCPYLNELGYDGSCGLLTEACSKEDGESNQRIIERLMEELKERDMQRSIAMPPADQRSFPAFDVCRIVRQDAYLPALQELQLLVEDKELFAQYMDLLKALRDVEMRDSEGRCLLWSSTDAQKVYSDDYDSSYSDAWSVAVDADGHTTVLSVKKSEEAWAVPYLRF